SAQPPPGALGRRGRTRRQALPAAIAGPARTGAGLRQPAPSRLPARTGAAADVSTRTPLLDASSRHWALAAAGSCLLPLLLQLPAMLALGIGIVAVVVALLSWRRVMPAWVRLLLVLGLVGAVLSTSRFGFGRDTACAMLAAMLAIKPGETFTLRDARSLVGFALFAPFATFLLDQGPIALGLGLVGATLALAALLRLAELDPLPAVAGPAPALPPL